MAPVLKQDGRIGGLTTPLSPDGESDPLALVRFEGSEGVSELFNFTVEAISTNPAVNFDRALGEPCTVKIKTKGPDRVFNGILVAAQATGPRHEDFYGYRLTLRPWLWLHTRTTDCRIFQNKTAPQIIEEVFKERGFGEFEARIDNEGSFPKLEYCVQYRESDFNFVSRLMEKEGLFYFFEHHDGKHVLVLTNANSKLHDLEGHETINFNVVGSHSVGTDETINHWTSARQIRSGVFELNDYNYETPNAKMIANQRGTESYKRSDMEIYDYPGNYKDAGVGDRYAKIALESEQAQDHRRYGDGFAISLQPGGLTTLKALPVTSDLKKFQPADAEFQKYIVVRAIHSYGTQEYGSRSGHSSHETFHGNYEFQPADRPFRAPLVTPKPRIFGVQTAVVVDKNAKGRVDSSPEEIEVEKLTEVYVSFYWDRRKHDEKRSVKLRVAQVWSGKNWGGQFIPRIGMEVVVEFLDGDPDRPLIVGCVYNNENQPPYTLPDHKTQSGIKSNSSKGGGGYNELMFEDKKGSEKIRMHAQNDHEIIVLHDTSRSIGHNLDTTVHNAETRTIGDKFKQPTGGVSHKTTIKNGDVELKVESGTLKYEAKLKMEFIVGPSKITIDPTGITLDAPMINIKAAALCVIQGLPVKIN
jgi:type VI secretion system secreted protein VgrG